MIKFSDLPDGALFLLTGAFIKSEREVYQKTNESDLFNAVVLERPNVGIQMFEDDYVEQVN